MHQNLIYNEKGISDSGELAGVGENQAKEIARSTTTDGDGYKG